LDPQPHLQTAVGPSLFAFPAQSNFSGVQHPLDWVRDAQGRGYRVLLDAAAYVPTHRLSLRQVPADFVAISFYKMFGYPTGVGALLGRHEAMRTLRRRFFGGGTVQFVSVQNRVERRKTGSEGFEDGTPSFLAMPAVCDGIRWWREVNGPATHVRLSQLTADLLARLTMWEDRVVEYGPRDLSARGATVAFNLRRNGLLIPYEEVEASARTVGLAIRGGCFCNPGAAERAFNHAPRRARACLQRGPFSIPRFRTCLQGAAVGALRVSLGIATSDADVARLVDHIAALVG
jgi:selenocysteine lyase/cysteine desulfurase